MPDNNERAERQERLPIEVIVGNPPWSAGQRRASDENPNVDYPDLKASIRKTYAKYSTATLKNSLYDSYKMAIRWASNRIKQQGVIAFVTNGSWIDASVDSGVRACLVEEFSSIYVLHLRGNARTSGERRRAERDNVFGQGSRAPVAITILVKNPNTFNDRCQIYYRDIGDYLSREQKLTVLKEVTSTAGFSDWRVITPDDYHDWIGQRNEVFTQFYPLGSEAAKAANTGEAVFELFSNGYKTGRDAHIYNFSRTVCADNARRMTQDYLAAIADLEQNPDFTEDEAARRHSASVKWDGNLKNKLKRKIKSKFADNYIRKVLYRPFVPTNCYADQIFAQRRGQMDKIFPEDTSENRVICVPGIGSKKPYSALVTNTMPDLGFNEAAQCFPRYRYPKPAGTTNTNIAIEQIEEPCDYVDNISDTALRAFRQHYRSNTITKNGIFDLRLWDPKCTRLPGTVCKRLVKRTTAHPVCARFPRLRGSGESPSRTPPRLRNVRTAAARGSVCT